MQPFHNAAVLMCNRTEIGEWVEWHREQVGEGTLTIATIFLTAFRPHVRGRREKIGF